MRAALLSLVFLCACSAQSDGPLFASDTALPLKAGTSRVIDLVMPDGDGGKVQLSVLDDGRTLLLAAAEKGPVESDEDLALTFHPLPGVGDTMISQGQIVIRGTPKNELHGYHILECPIGGQLGIFRFDLPSLEELGPFEGVDFNGLYVPDVRSADGLIAFFRAARTLESFTPLQIEPVINCDMIFE